MGDELNKDNKEQPAEQPNRRVEVNTWEPRKTSDGRYICAKILEVRENGIPQGEAKIVGTVAVQPPVITPDDIELIFKLATRFDLSASRIYAGCFDSLYRKGAQEICHRLATAKQDPLKMEPAQHGN